MSNSRKKQREIEKHLRKPIRQCSNNLLVDAMFDLKTRQFRKGRWLGSTNRYKTKTTQRFDKDILKTTIPAVPPVRRRVIYTPKRAFNKNNISQYVATSIILHCHDGWSFLTKAVKSLLDGDVHTCVHLAYYAELRAAMSLFAGSGIGIFSSKHIWFDENGNSKFIVGPKTHEFAEYGINLWSKTPNQSGNLLNIIKINGISISDWIRSAAAGAGTPTLTLLTENWLETWSLDLKTFGKDHFIRNLASYRPQEIENPNRKPFSAVVRTLVEFWKTCEPTNYGRFELLDLYLLRHSLEKIYDITGVSSRGVSYQDFILNTLTGLGVGNTNSISSFLLKRTFPDNHLIFLEAEKESLFENQIIDAIPMLARAILLLRLSTAITTDILEKSRVEKIDLKFWWDVKGRETGLWNNTSSPTSMSDLWADINQIITDIDSWLSTASPDVCILESRMDVPFELWGLSKFQLAGFWGIWD